MGVKEARGGLVDLEFSQEGARERKREREGEGREKDDSKRIRDGEWLGIRFMGVGRAS